MLARLLTLAAVALPAPALGQGLVMVLRPNAGPFGGSALAPVGDVDGDGVPDIAIGSAGFINGAVGSVTVFSGRTNEELYRPFIHPDNFSAGLTLANLGDLDGDGLSDLAAGDELWGNFDERRGAVTLTQGGTGNLIELLVGDASLELFGWSVDRVPDVDMDGIADLAVGAPGADVGARDAGAAILYSGSTRQRLWRIEGTDTDGALGYVVRGIEDVDGDGRGDVVVSAPGAAASTGEPGAGRVLILSGASGAVVRSFDGAAPDESFGRALAVLDDADGDGLQDVLVGSPFASNGALSTGRVDVLSSATGVAIRSFAGVEAGESVGQHVGEAGDLDGDGAMDFAFVRRLDGFGFTEAQCVAVSGATGAVLFRTSSSHFDADRRPITSVGDLGGDGIDDLVLGDPRDGRVRVYQTGDRPSGSICEGQPNSRYPGGAELQALSPSEFRVDTNDIVFRCVTLPSLTTGYLLVSTTVGFVPGVGGSEGNLCIAGPPFGRYANDILDLATGSFLFPIDNSAIPISGAPGGTVQALPGDTFYFQFWYRDVSASGAPTSNLSSALAITYR
ncbi:MAG: integrin alpha [Planctomycetota bacterium]